jgi:hypothetical protein
MGAALAATLGSGALVAQIPGRNVNMVSGTTLPDGDPYLQRQNEPSIAASTRNPLHLLGGSNDYRTVDIPGLPNSEETGDAWLGVFKSVDGGQRWKSTLVPGYPQDQSAVGLASPLKGYQAGADPVVRAGTNGLFYYAGLAFDRGDTGRSAIFVARFIDKNDRESGDPVAYLGTRIVASNPGTQFLDKPWLAVDVPRSGATCSLPAANSRTQQVPAGPAYVSWTAVTGSGANVRSQVFLSRSLDCGVTWSAPITLSRSQDPINQGSTIAINPNTGAVIVAWRSFATPGGSTTDSILAATSIDFGNKFGAAAEAHRFPTRGRSLKLPPWVFEHRGKDKDRGNDDDDDDRIPTKKLKFNPARPVDALAAFDQPGAGDRFRTNGYPTMTIDGSGRVYVAWSERGFSTLPGRTSTVDGDAKIVMSTSSNGIGWTTAVAVAEASQPGHQFMPSLAFAGGKLMLLFYDLRDDVSQSFSAFADDTSARPSGRRRTMDIRASVGTLGSVPAFAPSVKVSDYARGSRLGSLAIEQMQYNPPNLPMFKLGTVPFVGDYIDLAPSPAFLQDSRGVWMYNTQTAVTLPAFQAVWTDNRDVRPPTQHNPDGSLDWTRYSPPRSTFNPGAVCDPGSVGSRNQNIYTSRITGGLIAGSPGNNKPLNALLQRGFVVFAQNTTAQIRTFRLTIVSQPGGGRASFSQFPAPPFVASSAPPLTSIDVATAPRSLAARTVYVTSTNPQAQVQVDVREIATVGGPTVTGGLQATVFLNPDITNPDIQNPDIQNPDIQNPDIQNAEVHNPDITNPDITNPDIQNPDIQNPDIQNPDIQNPDIQNPDIQNPDITNAVVMNPDIINPDITNPDIQNPDIQNPDIQNPDIQNPDIQNGAISDVTWTMQNNGNTTTAYNVNLFLSNTQLPSGLKYQLILSKVYNTPVAINCDLKLQQRTVLVANIPNPEFVTPQSAGFVDQNDPRLTNPTLWLAPGEAGRLTLRLVDPHPVGYVTIPGGASVPPALLPALQTITPVIIPQPVGSPEVLLGQTRPIAVTPNNSTIIFLQQPGNALVGQAIAPAVRVQVRDTAGAVLPGVGVTLSLGTNPGGASLLGGAAATTNASGIATFAALSLDTPGSGYTLVATAGVVGITPAVSAPFLVSAAPPVVFIASALPSPVATGIGQLLTIRGTNLPGTSAADIVVAQGDFQATATYAFAATPSLVIARLPGLNPGQATVRIRNAADSVSTAPYSVTISQTPGTPTILKAMSANCLGPAAGFSALSGVTSGQAISVAAEGVDTASTEFLFTHSVDGVIGPVAETCSFGNDLGGVAAGVTLPAMNAGTVSIQIRTSVNGVFSAWSNPSVQTVLLGPAGGTGGSPYGPLACSPGSYATGFRVDGTNTYALTAAQLMCSDGIDTPAFGGAPVPNLPVACAQGLRMIGFFGTDDGGSNFGNPVVSSVGARCQAAGGGPITTVGPAPGSGNSFGPFDCPAGQVIVAVQGRSGAVVDSIALACSTVP